MINNLNYKNLFAYLNNLGIVSIQELENISIDAKYSKNFSWVLNFPTGSKLFVKKEPYYSGHHTDNKICNEGQIYRFLQSSPDLVYASSLAPEILYFDDNNSILIYKCSTDYMNLESYYDNNKDLPTSIANLIGNALAKLHLETMSCRDCFNFMNQVEKGKFRYQLPYPDYLLDRIEPESLSKFPTTGWNFLACYQRYESLRKAVIDLVVHHQRCCLTHNNLQLNKILIPTQWQNILFKTDYSDVSIIKLIDWGECSWGDPACDLGAAIAGYLLVWLNSITVHPVIELEKSLQLATIPLEVIHPSIVTMTRAYIRTYSKVLEDCPDFLKRVIQFAGFTLINKILVIIQNERNFNNKCICMLQVAKKLLCQPDQSFISVFGLTELALIDTILNSVN